MAQDYARIAETYYRTYLPSQYAKIEPGQREAFFQSLAAQVQDQVGYLTEDNLRAASRPDDSPLARTRKENMAALKAEEEALAELVYLPPEPGTQDRQLPRRSG